MRTKSLVVNPHGERGSAPCFRTFTTALACLCLAMLCGCASNSPLANDPLTAIFTATYIPRLPAPTDPSHTYEADASATWTAVDRVIQAEHAVVVSSNQQSGVITFYTDYSPRFITNHIKNGKEFIKAMAEGKEPLPAYVWSRFDDDAQAKLQASAQGKESEINSLLLVQQLNNLIYGPSIFDGQRFAKVTLRKETQESMKDTSSPDAISRTNRRLLEDGLQKYIGKTTLFIFRPAFTRYYTTVLLTARSSGSGTIAHVTTWKNGYNPPEADLSKPFFTLLDKEVRQ